MSESLEYLLEIKAKNKKRKKANKYEHYTTGNEKEI